MYFITHYMERADDRGYVGYRVLPLFTSGPLNILPLNPSRPSDFTLSAAYTHDKIDECNAAMAAAAQEDQFPGQHTVRHE